MWVAASGGVVGQRHACASPSGGCPVPSLGCKLATRAVALCRVSRPNQRRAATRRGLPCEAKFLSKCAHTCFGTHVSSMWLEDSCPAGNTHSKFSEPAALRCFASPLAMPTRPREACLPLALVTCGQLGVWRSSELVYA